METIVLCGKKSGCCPEVYLDFDTVSIKDDDKNMVTMNTEQFKILKEKILEGKFDIIAK